MGAALRLQQLLNPAQQAHATQLIDQRRRPISLQERTQKKCSTAESVECNQDPGRMMQASGEELTGDPAAQRQQRLSRIRIHHDQIRCEPVVQTQTSQRTQQAGVFA